MRFPECLRLPDRTVTPFAVQPGQMLTPEGCAVALHVEGADGAGWIGLWRPAERRVHHVPAPAGWLTGTGLWTADGVLRLPYSTGAVPCGVAALTMPDEERRQEDGSRDAAAAAAGPPSPHDEPGKQYNSQLPTSKTEMTVHHLNSLADVPRPVPLQQAPLGRLVTN